jgi:hypothetical protein
LTSIILAILKRYKTLKSRCCWVLCRSSAEKLRLRYLESVKKKVERQASINSSRICRNHLHKSSAEETIMIHEKIVFKNKQSVESKSSNRSMKKNRRESIIFTNETKNEFDAASTSYHIQNIDQLKYWLKKNKVSIATTWTNMRDEHVAFFNQLNKKINELNELTKDYNIQTNKLHDVIFIIHELKVEQRERNVEAINSNTSLFITEDEIIVFTSKKCLILLFSLMTRISSSMIDCQSYATSWKKTRIDFSLTFNKKHTYESKLMTMSWSILFLDFSRIRLNRISSRKKFSTIYIKYSTIQIVVLTRWKRINVLNK